MDSTDSEEEMPPEENEDDMDSTASEEEMSSEENEDDMDSTESKEEMPPKEKKVESNFFHACRTESNLETIAHMITEQGANIDQLETYSGVPMTPLWLAVHDDKTELAKLLISHGANVHFLDRSSTTLASLACQRQHLDIVMLLGAKGADFNQGDENGRTCLMHSVTSLPIMKYLIKEKAADLSKLDKFGESVLHHASREGYLSVVKLLFYSGADIKVRNLEGNDALQIAALKGEMDVFKFLKGKGNYSPEQKASGYELLGASIFFDGYTPSISVHDCWYVACSLRFRSGSAKDVLPPQEHLGLLSEFSSFDDLHSLPMNADIYEKQALMIFQRVLGSHHDCTIARLSLRGDHCLDEGRFKEGIAFKKHVLQLMVLNTNKLSSDSIYYCKTLACRLSCILKKGRDHGTFKPFVDVFELFLEVILKYATVAASKLFDDLMKVFVIFIICLSMFPEIFEGFMQIKRSLFRVLHDVAPQTSSGETILHLNLLSCNEMTIHVSHSFGSICPIFPSYEAVKLLLECGLDVNAPNVLRETPLHYAVFLKQSDPKIIALLLDYGANLHYIANCGRSPVDYLQESQYQGLSLAKYTTLEQLAAKAVRVHKLQFKGQVPLKVEKLI